MVGRRKSACINFLSSESFGPVWHQVLFGCKKRYPVSAPTANIPPQARTKTGQRAFQECRENINKDVAAQTLSCFKGARWDVSAGCSLVIIWFKQKHWVQRARTWHVQINGAFFPLFLPPKMSNYIFTHTSWPYIPSATLLGILSPPSDFRAERKTLPLKDTERKKI